MIRLTALALFAVLAVLTAPAQDTRAYYSDQVPGRSETLPGYSARAQRAKADSAALQGIEGIWEYPDEMMTVAIERFSSPRFSPRIAYRIVMLESDDDQLLPGTVIGYAAPSARADKFELWIYSERDGETLLSPVSCVATLSDGSLVFTRMKELTMRYRVNLTRFLPTLFRGISVYPQMKEERLPVGFRKIYPADGSGRADDEIRYL